jgi:ketosteroid isomerase-like protein
MKTPKELLKAYTNNVYDATLAASFFAEDGALELPYLTTLGLPARAQGPEEVKAFLENLHNLFADFKFHSLEVFMETANQVFAEYQATTTVTATGKPMHQHYMGRLVARYGKIKLLRESLDTAAAVKSLDIPGF